MKKTNKITAQERDLIAIWRGEGVSIRQIARRLGRNPSSVSREVRRNNFKDSQGRKYYVAIHAQARSDKRKSLARKRHPLKSPAVYGYVIGKLRLGWSPEQIAGRLRKDHGKTMICHETIYAFIYSHHPEARRLRLWECLPRKRKKRSKKLGRKVHRGRIPDRISIHQRPRSINSRKTFGHWEGDSVEGRKIDKDGIHTEVERLSRMTKAQKVIAITSKEANRAQERIFAPLPKKARKSTTLDNGKENHLHVRLKKKLKMETFFADPYRSGQRGTNEYHNGLLRRYLPKKTDLTTLTQGELDDIVQEINNRPRKVLNYNTPKEVFETYLDNLGVAIQL